MSHDQARARIQERFGVAAEGAGPLLIVTVPPERWVELASFARDSLGCLYFNFLTAVDWKEQGLEVVTRVENLDVGLQFKDLIPGVGTDAADAAQIAPGCGAILQRGAHKVAAYRGEDGSLVELSALCTHLGCVVQWNTLEGSWDCPCHGSRFAPTGEVLNGPALAPLSRLEGGA